MLMMYLLIVWLGLIIFSPALGFLFAFNKYTDLRNVNNESFDTRFGVSGLEKYSNFDFAYRDPKDVAASCRDGRFIGFTDETSTYNCQAMCDDQSGKMFEYTFFKKEVTLFGRKYLGGYCLPKLINHCNLSVATPIWQGGYIGCIPKYPNILDENNKIVGCNGQLVDNLTGIVHLNYLSPDTQFTHIDTRLSTGGYRFECNGSQRDEMGNSLIVLPNGGDRFELVRNPCSVFTKNADTSKIRLMPDYTCNCSAPFTNLYGHPNSPCITCETKFRPDTFTISVARPVFTRGVTLNQLKNIKHIIMPPGLNSLESIAGCERAELYLTDSYSPQLLAQI